MIHNSQIGEEDPTITIPGYLRFISESEKVAVFRVGGHGFLINPTPPEESAR